MPGGRKTLPWKGRGVSADMRAQTTHDLSKILTILGVLSVLIGISYARRALLINWTPDTSFFWYQDIIDTDAGQATVVVVAIVAGVWGIVGTVWIHRRTSPWVPFMAAHALFFAGVLSIGNLGMVLAFSSAVSILLIGRSWSVYEGIATRRCTRCGLEMIGGFATCPHCSPLEVKSGDQQGYKSEDVGDTAPRLYHVFRPTPGRIGVELIPPEIPTGALVNTAGCLMMISGSIGLITVPLLAKGFPIDYGFETGVLLSASVVGIVGGLMVLCRRIYWFGLASALMLLSVAYVEYFLAIQGMKIIEGAQTTFTQGRWDQWSWVLCLYWSIATMATFAVLYLLLSRDELEEVGPA